VTAKDILLAVIIPLILAEVGPWCGWLAARLLPWAARLRYGDTDRAAVRLEEWSGDLGDIPGQLTKLAYAIGQLGAGSAVHARRKLNRAMRETQNAHTAPRVNMPTARINADRPYADEVWQRLKRLAADGIADPPGEQVFPGEHEHDDARAWDDPDLRRDLSIFERVWVIADLQRRAAEQARRLRPGK
jgi:hypothetical protein